MPRHFLDLFHLEPGAARGLIDRALDLKRHGPKGLRAPRLAGHSLGLVFDKPSMRTRVSFEAAMAQLGGAAIYLSGQDIGLGSREPLGDFARVAGQYVDVLAVRTFAQETLEELARHSAVPVINALTDAAHPCQAMADLLTIRESLGRLGGVRLCFVGDGNNVARSLAVACALTGVDFLLACPADYDFPDAFRRRFGERFPGVALAVEHDPGRALSDADAVYTDVWTSMGQEAEAEARRAAFEPFRVDAPLFDRARPGAIFLHCLPARRGEEVTAEVIDGPRSLVVPQAANRMHLQKALLLELLDPDEANPAGSVVPNEPVRIA